MASNAIVCLDDFEKYAQETMSKYIFNFFSRGADEEVTLGENRNAFKRLVTDRNNTISHMMCV